MKIIALFQPLYLMYVTLIIAQQMGSVKPLALDKWGGYAVYYIQRRRCRASRNFLEKVF